MVGVADWLPVSAAGSGRAGVKYARRTDANHAAIRDGLRGLGYVVLDLSGAGDGIPDLAVAVAPGMPHFLELKDGAKPLSAQKLTAAQDRWHSMAWMVTSKVRSLEEAVAALKWAKEKVSERF
jgi:hypothetical protein